MKKSAKILLFIVVLLALFFNSCSIKKNSNQVYYDIEQCFPPQGVTSLVIDFKCCFFDSLLIIKINEDKMVMDNLNGEVNGSKERSIYFDVLDSDSISLEVNYKKNLIKNKYRIIKPYSYFDIYYYESLDSVNGNRDSLYIKRRYFKL